jgi:hypothetical protein
MWWRIVVGISGWRHCCIAAVEAVAVVEFEATCARSRSVEGAAVDSSASVAVCPAWTRNTGTCDLHLQGAVGIVVSLK